MTSFKAKKSKSPTSTLGSGHSHVLVKKNQMTTDQQVLNLLKQNSLSVTAPRKVILKLLISKHGPFTAEEIFLQLPKNSCLNVNVSAWASYYETANPKQVNLLTWLNSPKYAQQVEAIRAAGTKAERDKLKALLPAITPSGIFSRRDEAGLIKHSGFMQVDIDHKENAHIGNYTELKAQLAK
jgi:hypothetical protein